MNRCRKALPTSDCDHPALAFPRLFANSLTDDDTDGLPVRFTNRAIAGMRTKDVSSGGDLVRRVDDLVQDDPDVAVLMLGANDLLGDPLCALRARCIRTRLRRELTATNLSRLLRRLIEETGADIYLVRYYHVDVDIADTAVRHLNAAIDDAIGRLGVDADAVTMVTPPSFAGHGCEVRSGARWMLGKRVDGLCLHPNRLGHQKIAEALLTAFRRANDSQHVAASETTRRPLPVRPCASAPSDGTQPPGLLAVRISCSRAASTAAGFVDYKLARGVALSVGLRYGEIRALVRSVARAHVLIAYCAGGGRFFAAPRACWAKP